MMSKHAKSVCWIEGPPEIHEHTSQQAALECCLEALLCDVYTPEGALEKAQTHCGYMQIDNAPADDVGAKLPTLLRSTSCPNPDDGTLDPQSFLERSAIAMRVQHAYKYGGGYNCPKLAAFKPQDVYVWKRLLSEDWTQQIGGDVDVIFYINNWFGFDFRKEPLNLMMSIDPDVDDIDEILNGVATPVDPDELSAVHEKNIENSCQVWTCLVCKRESTGDDVIGAQFCVACHTSRNDATIWMCPGTSKTTLPKHLRKPCGQLMRMQDLIIGVPCCSTCGAVRHRFNQEEVFAAFSNVGDVLLDPSGEERPAETDEPRPVFQRPMRV